MKTMLPRTLMRTSRAEEILFKLPLCSPNNCLAKPISPKVSGVGPASGLFSIGSNGFEFIC